MKRQGKARHRALKAAAIKVLYHSSVVKVLTTQLPYLAKAEPVAATTELKLSSPEEGERWITRPN
jgi:hypothetical protein